MATTKDMHDAMFSFGEYLALIADRAAGFSYKVLSGRRGFKKINGIIVDDSHHEKELQTIRFIHLCGHDEAGHKHIIVAIYCHHHAR